MGHSTRRARKLANGLKIAAQGKQSNNSNLLHIVSLNTIISSDSSKEIPSEDVILLKNPQDIIKYPGGFEEKDLEKW